MIPMSSILAFEERREQAAREADTFSAELEAAWSTTRMSRSQTAIPGVVLDSNVIFSRVLHELRAASPAVSR